jgi:hypothetical protein
MQQLSRRDVVVGGAVGGAGTSRLRVPHELGPQGCARLIGALYLVVFGCGVFSELVVRGALIVDGDAAATAANVVASDGLFRVGLASDLVMLLADVGVAVLLYALLRPIGRTLALLAAAFRLVMTAVIAASLIAYSSAGELATGYTTALGAEPADALVLLSLEAHAQGYLIALVFFGLHLLVLGWLLLRSRYVPRFLAGLLLVAGVGYLVDSFAAFLSPAYDGALSPIVLAPAFVAELALPLWLLVKGVDLRRGPA